MKTITTAMSALPVMMALMATNPGNSQTPATPPAGPQQKIQALQEAAAQNEQRLHQYQWIETTTVTLNGTARPPKQAICRYTPYGTLNKTQLGPQQAPPQASGGPLRRHIEEKKIAEVEQNMASVRELTAMYLPMNPGVFKQALQTRRVDFEHQPAGGNALIITDYAKPGDRFMLEIDPATMRIRRLTVKSYFGSPSETFLVSVDFSMLGDGTTYPSLTRLDAPQKHLTIRTVNSSFSRAAQ